LEQFVPTCVGTLRVPTHVGTNPNFRAFPASLPSLVLSACASTPAQTLFERNPVRTGKGRLTPLPILYDGEPVLEGSVQSSPQSVEARTGFGRVRAVFYPVGSVVKVSGCAPKSNKPNTARTQPTSFEGPQVIIPEKNLDFGARLKGFRSA
jgi:hypothetical protein